MSREPETVFDQRYLKPGQGFHLLRFRRARPFDYMPSHIRIVYILRLAGITYREMEEFGRKYAASSTLSDWYRKGCEIEDRRKSEKRKV